MQTRRTRHGSSSRASSLIVAADVRRRISARKTLPPRCLGGYGSCDDSRTHPASSSFESKQIVSEPQPDPCGDERPQERQPNSFERDRILFKIPEPVRPFTGLREVRPVTTAREESVIRRVAEQESGKGPLHGEDDAKKTHRECGGQQP